MAIYVFNAFKTQLANGYIHLDDATRDGSTITGDNTHTPVTGVFRVCLIQPSSSLVTATTDNSGTAAIDCGTVAAITTLNEVDRTNYTPMASGNETDTHLSSLTLSQVTGASGYEKWDAADVTVNSVASGQDINGLLIVWDKNTGSTNLSTKIPLVWIGLDENISTNGGNITITWASTGIAQIT
ncbi:hypothetical protein [Acinetobacter sp.]|uniref:hypothetical protein n=1 Tax=Acinetobacter sp. TaxID=472 RepID=UPI000C0AE3B8|nr:hypothetical protein [Acinetobacter sp.]MAK29882.1 hypothetical protein [Acinetobacter sp.]|tara:strand:- start:2818 stop:3369 length:552 start_codon:yes stop_codon:yes gene_type:complete